MSILSTWNSSKSPETYLQFEDRVLIQTWWATHASLQRSEFSHDLLPVYSMGSMAEKSSEVHTELSETLLVKQTNGACWSWNFHLVQPSIDIARPTLSGSGALWARSATGLLPKVTGSSQKEPWGSPADQHHWQMERLPPTHLWVFICVNKLFV